MFAKMVSGIVQPGKLDELVSVFEESILPAAKKLKGFKGGYLLTDKAGDKFTSISLWKSEADMLAGDDNTDYQEQVAKIAQTLAAVPDKQVFKVSLKAK